MAFIYDKTRRAATEPDTGASVRSTHRFLDDSPVFTFEYQNSDVTFEFTAAIDRQNRTYTFKGRSLSRVVDVGYYVLEQSIKSGYADAWAKAHPENPRGAALSDASYVKLKTSIREGLSVLGTAGGTQIPLIDDFRVGFIENLAQLKSLISRQ